MIEEHALVSKVQGRQVWVKTVKASVCKHCYQQQGCSAAVLETAACGRELQVESDISLVAGDWVVLAINAKKLLLSAAALYLTPLIALLLGGVAGEWVAARFYSFDSDLIIVLFALAFFLGSLFFLNRLQRAGLSRFLPNPTILRKL